jgi:hypothetical protein
MRRSTSPAPGRDCSLRLARAAHPLVPASRRSPHPAELIFRRRGARPQRVAGTTHRVGPHRRSYDQQLMTTAPAGIHERHERLEMPRAPTTSEQDPHGRSLGMAHRGQGTLGAATATRDVPVKSSRDAEAAMTPSCDGPLRRGTEASPPAPARTDRPSRQLRPSRRRGRG